MAKHNIPMPQLGESVTEGTIGKWLVKPGDRVKKYEPLCEVITDKVNAEVPSSFEGTISEILIPEETTVSVGEIICTIVEETGVSSESAEPQVDSMGTAAPAVTQQTISTAASQPVKPALTSSGAKVRYSPAVLQLSQEHGIDLSQVTGTGAEGRITRKDVLQVISQGGTGASTNQNTTAADHPKLGSSAPSSADTASNRPYTDSGSGSSSDPVISQQAGKVTESGDRVIDVTPVRRTIANRMLQSKHEIPHAWMMIEVDVTNLVKLRESVKDEFARKEGIKLTYLPFFVKAIVGALKEYPLLNSVWEGDRIVIKKGIHLSMAVATEDSLYTPVIRNADQKSITGLAMDIEDLAKKTRAGKLSIQDMQGGTFTVNNTGSFGSIQSMPIINYPQAAILSIESIVKRPVVIDDMIAVRSMVNLCLSLDHRTLDGLICGRFLQRVKQNLEEFGSGTKLY